MIALALIMGNASCVPQQQAADIFFPSSCEGLGEVSPVGDKAKRYIVGTMHDGCQGRRKVTYSDTTWTLVDCISDRRLEALVSRVSGDPSSRGPDFDQSAVVERLQSKLKAGTTDFDATLASLMANAIVTKELSENNASYCRPVSDWSKYDGKGNLVASGTKVGWD